jgi:hypothetical protein
MYQKYSLATIFIEDTHTEYTYSFETRVCPGSKVWVEDYDNPPQCRPLYHIYYPILQT